MGKTFFGLGVFFILGILPALSIKGHCVSLSCSGTVVWENSLNSDGTLSFSMNNGTSNGQCMISSTPSSHGASVVASANYITLSLSGNSNTLNAYVYWQGSQHSGSINTTPLNVLTSASDTDTASIIPDTGHGDNGIAGSASLSADHYPSGSYTGSVTITAADL
jgi:hypothetical protein